MPALQVKPTVSGIEQLRDYSFNYKEAVRPQLEYSIVFWSPHCQEDVIVLERIQVRFTSILTATNWESGNAISLENQFSASCSEGVMASSCIVTSYYFHNLVFLTTYTLALQLILITLKLNTFLPFSWDCIYSKSESFCPLKIVHCSYIFRPFSFSF